MYDVRCVMYDVKGMYDVRCLMYDVKGHVRCTMDKATKFSKPAKLSKP